MFQTCLPIVSTMDYEWLTGTGTDTKSSTKSRIIHMVSNCCRNRTIYTNCQSACWALTGEPNAGILLTNEHSESTIPKWKS